MSDSELEALRLKRYRNVIEAVDQRYDVRGSDLSRLVVICLDEDGKLSKHRREQFQDTVQREVFDFVEGQVQALLIER